MSGELIRSMLRAFPLLGVLLFNACGDNPSPTASKPTPPPQQPGYTIVTDYYGFDQADEITTASDGTELDDESLAASCPHFDGITRPLNLGVRVTEPNGEEHIASFVFEGFKPFVRYEGRGGLPVGVFGPVARTLSERDARTQREDTYGYSARGGTSASRVGGSGLVPT